MGDNSTEEVQPLHLYSRSHVVTDWKCKRQRYLGYEYEGRGLSPATLQLELFLGTSLHDGLAAIASQQHETSRVDIDFIARTIRDSVYQTLAEGEEDAAGLTYANEQASLIEGLLRAYHRHMWPILLRQYPIIIAIERECLFKHGRDAQLGFMAKPDLIMSDTQGNWVYVEMKSTSSKKEEWISSWNTAIQLHSTCRAIEATLGQKVELVIVQGFWKGYQAYGRQSSPLCYGYVRSGQPPFTKDEVSYEYRAGFRRVPTWEMKGGVREWVANMPSDILSNLLPQTPPIFIRDGLVDSFFRQCEFRESEIELAMSMLRGMDEESRQGILDVSFPQNFEACSPGWGRACQFRNICHGSGADPLRNGQYSLRESHHELEAAQHDTTAAD